jgi:archaellum biogenesis protein FlaJ (TadC family)
MIVTFFKAHIELFWWFGFLSLITLFFSLVIIPIFIIRMPHDYFVYEQRRNIVRKKDNIIIRILCIGIKNILGALFIFTGLLMLVLPGQGILTILIGLMIMNFPGKYRFEKRLIQYPAIYRAINWIRLKAHRKQLQHPHTK